MSKLTVKQLAEGYGTLDLLTAYLMRKTNIDEEEADNLAYIIDFDLERRFDDELYSDIDEQEDEDWL